MNLISNNFLESHIIKYCELNGFITINKFMDIVLNEYPQSYYRNNNAIFGKTGDFVTAPEISQLFGEMVGLWCIDQYHNFNTKSPINLIELGPGRGYLMRDILNAIKLVPEFSHSLSISLIEINEDLIIEQKTNLKKFDNISWYSNLENALKEVNIKGNKTIFIANEFMDSLSIKQFKKIADDWCEVVIKYRQQGFYFCQNIIRPDLNLFLKSKYPHAIEGAIIEDAAAIKNIINLMASHLENFAGSALLIDYGYFIKPDERQSDELISTLQGIKNHKYNSIFDNLGGADITTQVNFYEICNELKNFSHIITFLTQRQFLLQYGIVIRKKLLQRNLPNNEKKLLNLQVERLIGHKEMGNLFKVLIFHNYGKQ